MTLKELARTTLEQRQTAGPLDRWLTTWLLYVAVNRLKAESEHRRMISPELPFQCLLSVLNWINPNLAGAIVANHRFYRPMRIEVKHLVRTLSPLLRQEALDNEDERLRNWIGRTYNSLQLYEDLAALIRMTAIAEHAEDGTILKAAEAYPDILQDYENEMSTLMEVRWRLMMPPSECVDPDQGLIGPSARIFDAFHIVAVPGGGASSGFGVFDPAGTMRTVALSDDLDEFTVLDMKRELSSQRRAFVVTWDPVIRMNPTVIAVDQQFLECPLDLYTWIAHHEYGHQMAYRKVADPALLTSCAAVFPREIRDRIPEIHQKEPTTFAELWAEWVAHYLCCKSADPAACDCLFRQTVGRFFESVLTPDLPPEVFIRAAGEFVADGIRENGGTMDGYFPDWAAFERRRSQLFAGRA